jgi:hypothetical protein
MRKLIAILSVVAVLGMSKSSQAVDIKLTLEDQSVNAGTTVAVKVRWTSTSPLNALSSQFILTAVGSSPAGEVTFTNTPADSTTGAPVYPPFNQSDYVFFGNSSDFIVDSENNPASVSTTNWNYDTYDFADSTDSGADVSPTAPNNLWTILNLTISSSATGSYQLTLGSSDFNNTTIGTGQVLTASDMTGGLITINPVPEPSTVALGVIASGVVVMMARRRRSQIMA